MSDAYCCPQGHAWSGSPRADGSAPFCPECGSPGAAPPSTPEPAEWVSARLELKVLGVPVRFELPVPAGPARPVDLLPQFRALGEALVSFSVQVSEADGKTVSCGPGCGACCRQLVPISQLEARTIGALVEGLPEPRRAAVRARFAAARVRFAAAGLLDQLLEPEAVAAEQRRSLALAYFRQGVACPFLEDESCSIYADRPISCREYLVTSPAANCSTPTRESVACVPVPLRASYALAGLTAAGSSTFVPLVVAPEWAANHPEPAAEPRTGPQVLEQFLGRLLQGKPDAPPTEAKEFAPGV